MTFTVCMNNERYVKQLLRKRERTALLYLYITFETFSKRPGSKRQGGKWRAGMVCNKRKGKEKKKA